MVFKKMAGGRGELGIGKLGSGGGEKLGAENVIVVNVPQGVQHNLECQQKL